MEPAQDNIINVAPGVDLVLDEISMSAIRATGSGGQNVNKVSSAIHLRFDIDASSLPGRIKARLKSLKDSRITTEGVVVIKSQQYRTQEKNRQAALSRLEELVRSVTLPRKKRIPTRPGKAAKKRRLDQKARRGRIKSLRGHVRPDGD